MLDLLILEKDENGDIEAIELDDLEEVGELRKIETQLAEILAEDDIAHLAAAMEPGSVAGVVIWENTWAAPFASCGPPIRRPAHRERTDPDASDHRFARSRAGGHEGRRLTCRLGPRRRARPA